MPAVLLAALLLASALPAARAECCLPTCVKWVSALCHSQHPAGLQACMTRELQALTPTQWPISDPFTPLPQGYDPDFGRVCVKEQCGDGTAPTPCEQDAGQAVAIVASFVACIACFPLPARSRSHRTLPAASHSTRRRLWLWPMQHLWVSAQHSSPNGQGAGQVPQRKRCKSCCPHVHDSRRALPLPSRSCNCDGGCRRASKRRMHSRKLA